MEPLFPVIGLSFVVIVYTIYNYYKIRGMDSGTPEMVHLAEIIRKGAKTFMKTQYLTVIIVAAVLALIFTFFIERTSGVTFAIGAIASSIVCVFGMNTATHANVRTTNTARIALSEGDSKRKAIGKTTRTALIGGSIPGLSVQTYGVLGVAAILLGYGGVHLLDPGSGLFLDLGVNASIMRLTTFSLGCSTVAMFNRVAGGNYTKAADISSDILAKIRHDMPEDDKRNPCTIADFIGDNVNDIAGNCSDLLESFVATMVAAIMIVMTIFSTEFGSEGSLITEDLLSSSVLFPVLVAAGGLFSCFIALFITSKRKLGENPATSLNSTTYLSAVLTILIALGVSYLSFGNKELYSSFHAGWWSPWIATVLGILSGVAIGIVTERYTSTDFRPTRSLAEIAPEGTAFVITKGDAIGSRSVLIPTLIIGIAIFLSGKVAGNFGIAMAALGMLSFVGTTVSIDAFGPIADNAGGIAESCDLGEDVRSVTDKLDAVGNTTAAIGKGFAIGSAALATVSLITAYVGNYTANGVEPVLNIANFVVVAGGIIGGGLIEYFSAMLTDNTIEAAKKMADVGDKILSEPGVIEGTKDPDYNTCIELAAKEALRRMLAPSLLAMFIPVIGGIIFGVEFVGGILVGATIVAIPRAIFMGNSGGAFDNAKKYIEQGLLTGYKKGSSAHKASVNGDTVGDTRKDVVGVALDIFIKMMSTVANTLAPIFSRFTFLR